MSTILIEDIAFVRFSAPDLNKMRTFLEDFGLRVSESARHDVLHMRGAGAAPFLHETSVGEPRFVGIGLRAADREALEKLADAEGVLVERLSSPGQGYRVSLQDPDGIQVDVVADQVPVEETAGDEPDQWNSTNQRRRIGRARSVRSGPAAVARLGHCVLRSSNIRSSEQWWKERFGFITSDEVVDDDGVPVAIFMRCDRGPQATDHHTVTLSQAAPGEQVGFHHAAFEVRDFDDLVSGHEFLQTKDYEAVWGIGRHVVGGQIFDYWLDPFGNRVEHWTDGDLYTAEDGSNVVGVDVMFSNHWGPPPSQRFVEG